MLAATSPLVANASLLVAAAARAEVPGWVMIGAVVSLLLGALAGGALLWVAYRRWFEPRQERRRRDEELRGRPRKPLE